MRHRNRDGPWRIGTWLAVMAVGTLLAGCAQSYPIPRAPDGNPIQAARELSDAPAEVRAGDAAESCGEFVLDQGEAVPADAVDCLSRAQASQEVGELAWTFPTTEGDPLVYFAFVKEGTGEVTVVITNAFDSCGGDPGWTSSSCGDVVAATSYAGCASP